MTQLTQEQEPVDLSGADKIRLTPEQRSKAMFKFIAFSLIGIAIFIIPLQWGGKTTILLGIFTDWLQGVIGNAAPYIALTIVTISALGALWATVLKPNLTNKPVLAKLFNVGWIWTLLRVVGAVFVYLIFFKIGPEWIINRNTGGVILLDLNPVLIPLFFFAILLLPFLIDYGLMEYMGTMVRKIFITFFRLPGRAAIDALSSWFGAASIGVLVTSQQYDKGYYSQREASVVATTFSVTSIAFTYVVAKTIGIDHLFVPFYLTIAAAGITGALIMPRIPPLSLKKEIYNTGKSQLNEAIPEGRGLHDWALTQAARRVHFSPSMPVVFKNSVVNLMDIYLGLMPILFAIGTVGLALTEFTPVFKILATPLVPFLELLQVPEAAKAAPAMLVGFADMYLPALVGKSIDNEMTRFVIGCASITQIIYMSEVGALILKSKIGLNILELFAIFVLRTIITVPIIALIAHVFIF